MAHVLLEVALPKLDELPLLPPSPSKDGFEEQDHHQQWDSSSSSEHVDGEFAGAGDWSNEGAAEQVVASSSSYGTNAAGEPVPGLLLPRSSSEEEEEVSMNRRALPLLFVMRDRGFAVVSSFLYRFDASSFPVLIDLSTLPRASSALGKVESHQERRSGVWDDYYE